MPPERVAAEARAQATALNGDTSTGPIQRLQAERQVWEQVLADSPDSPAGKRLIRLVAVGSDG